MTAFATCGGAFGSGGFGATPFGSGAALSVASAVEEALNAILVTFSVPPLAFDPANVNDALFAGNWSIAPRDPYNARVRLAQWVERVDELTVRVLFDGPLDAPATYRITLSPNVVDLYGVPLAALCAYADVQTFPPTRVPPEQAVPTEVRTDLNNPFLVKDATLADPPPLGTYQITGSGDYALERGRPYLRKRVLRRATTQMGEFFHLANYGFAEPLKSVIRPDLLRRMAAKATTQIRQEPDVESASVSARLANGTTNIVILDIKVRDRYGRVEELTVPVRIRSD